MKIQEKKGNQGEEAFDFFNSFLWVTGLRLCYPRRPSGCPLPVPDFLQQCCVFVISKLAPGWTRNVHDVSVGGHQNNSKWVLQLAAKGWGQRKSCVRGGPSFVTASLFQVGWRVLASGPGSLSRWMCDDLKT